MKDLRLFIRETIRELDSVILEATAEEIKLKYYPNISQYNFNKIVDSDKLTSNIENGKVGKYAKWLLNLYSKGNLNLEELDEYDKYIRVYDKLLKSKKIVNSDIHNFKSLSDLIELIKVYMDFETISKSDKIKKIKKQSKIIYSDDRFTVIQPLSEEASFYYGKGTKWCTTTSDKFDEYNAKGPLYIIIDKSKRNDRDFAKYQIHFETAEFKDERNKEIFFERNPELKEFIKKLIKKLGINEFKLVEKNPYNIQFIDNPSEELQLKVIGKKPYIINYIQNPTEKALKLAGIDPSSYKKYIPTNSEMIDSLIQSLNHGMITQDEFDEYSKNYI